MSASSNSNQKEPPKDGSENDSDSAPGHGKGKYATLNDDGSDKERSSKRQRDGTTDHSLLTSPAGGAGNGQGGIASGGGAPSAPHQTPTKESDLLVFTPSSTTTAGMTAASTAVTLTPSPLRLRRSRGGPAHPSGLRRQYQLLRSQILLLLGSASVGLALFLFYALPLAAFVSFALMTTSIGALFPVARSVVRARIQLEMLHPLGLTRYLPDSLRVLLTETTLHEYMLDPSFFLENRYLLLYFVPGLQPEQVLEFINQLPSRHRDALLQPGLGRLMPSVMGYLMRMDNQNRESHDVDTLLLEEDEGVSTGSDLTTHGEQHGYGGVSRWAVTLLEAVAGLPQTITGYPMDNLGGAGELPTAPGVALNGEACEDNQEGDMSYPSAEGDLSMLANGNADEAPATPAASGNYFQLRNVVVELPQPSGLEPSQQLNELNQEHALEGRLLSEAASAAVATFSAQATSAVRETATEVLAATSSWGIQGGALTGLIAGGGGIVAAVLANYQRGSTSPLYVTLGIASGPRRNADLVSSASGDPDGISGFAYGMRPDRQNGSSQWIRGMLATSALGFIGAGVAYLIRNRTRAAIAEKREKLRLDDVIDKDEGGVSHDFSPSC